MWPNHISQSHYPLISCLFSDKRAISKNLKKDFPFGRSSVTNTHTHTHTSNCSLISVHMEELWHKLLSLFFIQLRLACRHQNKHRNVNGTLENLSSFTNENSGWLVTFNIHLNMLMWSKQLETTTKTFHFQWNFTACKCFYSETLLTISVFINGYCPSLFPLLMNSHFRWQWKLFFFFFFFQKELQSFSESNGFIG